MVLGFSKRAREFGATIDLRLQTSRAKTPHFVGDRFSDPDPDGLYGGGPLCDHPIVIGDGSRTSLRMVARRSLRRAPARELHCRRVASPSNSANSRVEASSKARPRHRPVRASGCRQTLAYQHHRRAAAAARPRHHPRSTCDVLDDTRTRSLSDLTVGASATVFQDARLFPISISGKNLGLRRRMNLPRRGFPRAHPRQQSFCLSGHLLDRPPRPLSGCERSALRFRPRAVVEATAAGLLDEPLARATRAAANPAQSWWRLRDEAYPYGLMSARDASELAPARTHIVYRQRDGDDRRSAGPGADVKPRPPPAMHPTAYWQTVSGNRSPLSRGTP